MLVRSTQERSSPPVLSTTGMRCCCSPSPRPVASAFAGPASRACSSRGRWVSRRAPRPCTCRSGCHPAGGSPALGSCSVAGSAACSNKRCSSGRPTACRPPWLAAALAAGRVLASTAILLVMCAAKAVLFSHLTGIDWRTMLLATAPGSVTETALTAKLLQRGVVAVTAVHVARIVVIIPSASLLVLITARLAAKLQGAEGRGAEGRGKADRQASSQPPEPKTSCPFSLPPVAFARQRPVPTRARALLQAAAPAPSKSAQSPAVDHECCGIDWPSGRTKAHQRCTLRP